MVGSKLETAGMAAPTRSLVGPEMPAGTLQRATQTDPPEPFTVQSSASARRVRSTSFYGPNRTYETPLPLSR